MNSTGINVLALFCKYTIYTIIISRHKLHLFISTTNITLYIIQSHLQQTNLVYWAFQRYRPTVQGVSSQSHKVYHCHHGLQVQSVLYADLRKYHKSTLFLFQHTTNNVSARVRKAGPHIGAKYKLPRRWERGSARSHDSQSGRYCTHFAEWPPASPLRSEWGVSKHGVEGGVKKDSWKVF